MRLVNTARRRVTSVSGVRAARWTITCLLALVMLSACATGRSNTQEDVATREAEEATNVVANIEATQVVREFFGPTAEPTPYPTRLPSLANLTLTDSLRAQDAPGNQLDSVRRGSTVYADAQVANVFPGQRVVALWKDSGNVVASSEVNIDNPRELVWIPLRWDVPGSVPSGTYAVVIQVVGPGTNTEGTPVESTTEIGSLVFEVN